MTTGTRLIPMKNQLISIIVPVFNEEENVARAYEAIVAELDK